MSVGYIVPNADAARYTDFDLVPRNLSCLEFPTVRQTAWDEVGLRGQQPKEI